MKELFAFLDESSKVRLHTLLSQYISRYLKKQFPEPSVELFNGVNRKELAKEIINKNGQSSSFLIHKYNYKTTRTYTEREFFDDIVQYIDLKIPLYYYRQTMLQPNDDWIRFKKNYKGIRMFPGMNFEFFQNIEREKKWINQSLLCIEEKPKHVKPIVEPVDETLIEITLKPMDKAGDFASQSQIGKIKNLTKRMGITIGNLQTINNKTANVLIGNLSRGVIYTPLFKPDNLDLAFANLQRLTPSEENMDRDNFEANLMFLEQRKYAYQNMNKANTKSALIRPMLRMLGFELENPNEVYEEFECGDKVIDFAIMKNGKPFILIVVGDNRQATASMISPLLNKVPSASYLISTNGDDYHMFAVQNKTELHYLDSAYLRANSHNTPLLLSFSKDNIFGDDEPTLITKLKERSNRFEQISQVKQIIKNPPKELLDVLAKQGISTEAAISIFHDAVNEFSQDCKKTS